MYSEIVVSIFRVTIESEKFFTNKQLKNYISYVLHFYKEICKSYLASIVLYLKLPSDYICLVTPFEVNEQHLFSIKLPF